MNAFFALLSGVLFGLGLIGSGMTDPAKVKGFLDLFGHWDPSLALVMAGAIAVGVVAFAIAKRRTVSWTGARMEIPTSTTIERRLVVGGLLFGAGWGIAGFCPGPALVAASAGSVAALGFVAAMLVGMVLHDRLLASVWLPSAPQGAARRP
jgi:hypothetical protein